METQDVGSFSTCMRQPDKHVSLLADNYEDFPYSDFNSISRESGIERRQVRLDCRRMSRKGLLVFGKGLWSDDGEPRGSGYAITDAGRAALEGSEK